MTVLAGPGAARGLPDWLPSLALECLKWLICQLTVDSNTDRDGLQVKVMLQGPVVHPFEAALRGVSIDQPAPAQKDTSLSRKQVGKICSCLNVENSEQNSKIGFVLGSISGLHSRLKA